MPLASSVMELKTGSPFSFVLFGASGNLAKLKIYPALYTLALKKRIPADYAIIGYARTPMTDEQFRELVRESVQTDMIETNKKVLDDFLAHCHYHAGQYDKVDDFKSLDQALRTIEKGWSNDVVRLAYLSIPPAVFNDVLQNICGGGIRAKDRAFRAIVEKPVGHDLQSFERVKDTLMGCFDEEEIYLLDHYLGKEAVRNIHALRHANPIVERLLKNSLIHHVEIVADEAAGIGGRAGYFDATGTLRDWFQSHLIEIATLLTMRLHEGGTLPSLRGQALDQFYLPPAANLDDIIFQAQYTAGAEGKKPVVGYTEEEGVAKGSKTHTFIALKLMSRMWQWQGVPFYIRAGKRLEKKETRVSIQFQEPHAVGKGTAPNRLDIILVGEAGMRIHLQTKLGGTEAAYRPLILEDPLVCVGDCLPEHGLLLLEAIHGHRDWFMTFEEVRAAWKLTDPLQSHLEKPGTKLHTYAAGTKRPAEADAWIQRDGISWLP